MSYFLYRWAKLSLQKCRGIFSCRYRADKSLELKREKLKKNGIKCNLKRFKEGYLIDYEDMVFYLSSDEDFFVFNEIFIRNIYGVELNEKTIVIDIGSNIGLSTLFFARNDQFLKVFSFEAVKETYEHSLVNFDLNPRLKNKIEVTNIGLSNKKYVETFLYHEKNKATAGIRGKKSPSYKYNSQAQTVEVHMNIASVLIEPIILKYSQYKKVLKIDCEGGEYQIIENLSKSGLLEKIDTLILEWHDNGKEEITYQLSRMNFSFFYQNEGQTGLIYAIRN